METEVVNSMTSLLSQITAVVTAAIGWIGQFVTTITAEGHEILLVGVIFSFVGLGVGLISRLMKL